MELRKYVELRKPLFYVVTFLPGPALRSGGAETIGAFESEDNAVSWVGHNAPERALFSIVPVFDTL